MPNKNPGSVFKRFETDSEYRIRLKAKGAYTYGYTGEALDTVGLVYDCPRRIVEDEA